MKDVHLNAKAKIFVLICLGAKRGHLKWFEGLLPESQGQNLAVTVLHVPYAFDRGGVFMQACR
jgi:hypothetical protein